MTPSATNHTAFRACWLLCLLILLAACAPHGAAVPAIASMETASPMPTASSTLTTTPTQSPTPTSTPIPPTVTATPTPTVDPVTAEKIRAIREAVGDRVEDWISYHNETAPWNGKPVDMYELKLVYTGSEGKIENLEILDGNGTPIGKIRLGFRGQMLIGDELRELIIPFTFEDYASGKCQWLSPNVRLDCARLKGYTQKPEMTIERTGYNEWNAVPGQVISVFLKKPDPNTKIPSQMFLNSYLAGRGDVFDALISKGDTSIGLLFIFMHKRGQCDANNLVRVPYACYKEAERIVISGYQ